MIYIGYWMIWSRTTIRIRKTWICNPMIYTKLTIILLSEIATKAQDDPHAIIASTILANLDRLKNPSITELAQLCHVSISTFSRFCRSIGLNDFAELKDLMEENRPDFEVASTKDTMELRFEEHATLVANSLHNAALSLDKTFIEALVKDLHHYRKVTVFGLLKASAAAINLQTDLLMQNKLVQTKLAFSDQLAYLSQATPDDLIVIFSYTGNYFTQGLRAFDLPLRHPKIYLISGEAPMNSPFDLKWIPFTSTHRMLEHPGSLWLISSLIAQEYHHFLKSN